MSKKRTARLRTVTVGVGLVALAAGATACASRGGSSSPVAASAPQTIVFAESGLGTEGQQTQTAINAFAKANPNIKVTVQVLSPDSTTYLSQLEHDFISGSTTPDVFESDVTYPAKFAQAGWVLPLTQFKPGDQPVLRARGRRGHLQRHGLRDPVVRQPRGPVLPYRPGQDAADQPRAGGQRRAGGDEGGPGAQGGHRLRGGQVRGRDHLVPHRRIRHSAGRSTRQNVNTPGNVAALNWLHDAIYTSKIAPPGGDRLAGGPGRGAVRVRYTPFAIDYPFVEAQRLAPP